MTLRGSCWIWRKVRILFRMFVWCFNCILQSLRCSTYAYMFICFMAQIFGLVPFPSAIIASLVVLQAICNIQGSHWILLVSVLFRNIGIFLFDIDLLFCFIVTTIHHFQSSFIKFNHHSSFSLIIHYFFWLAISFNHHSSHTTNIQEKLWSWWWWWWWWWCRWRRRQLRWRWRRHHDGDEDSHRHHHRHHGHHHPYHQRHFHHDHHHYLTLYIYILTTNMSVSGASVMPER